VIIEGKKTLNYNDKLAKSYSKVKTTWNIIRVETGKQGKNKENIKPRKINPNAFSNHCLTIAENIPAQTTDNNRNYKYYLDLTHRSPFPKVRFINITTKDIEKVISSLHPKNSCGCDEISMKILYISAPYISSPLCYIFNKARTVGTLPSCLKYSIVAPIHKKDDKKNCANCRLISLLTSFSKVFEKMLCRRLITHINTNGVLANEQFGFCTKLSTETVSYNLKNGILKAFNNKGKVFFISFNLEKACSCINHEILVTKLEFYGITNNMCMLRKSYFQNRYQMVRIKDRPLLIIEMGFSQMWITSGISLGSIILPAIYQLTASSHMLSKFKSELSNSFVGR
jgi:Reverse transcriptase (RNA-dependent DNA polymerase).